MGSRKGAGTSEKNDCERAAPAKPHVVYRYHGFALEDNPIRTTAGYSTVFPTGRGDPGGGREGRCGGRGRKLAHRLRPDDSGEGRAASDHRGAETDFVEAASEPLRAQDGKSAKIVHKGCSYVPPLLLPNQVNLSLLGVGQPSRRKALAGMQKWQPLPASPVALRLLWLRAPMRDSPAPASGVEVVVFEVAVRSGMRSARDGISFIPRAKRHPTTPPPRRVVSSWTSTIGRIGQKGASRDPLLELCKPRENDGPARADGPLCNGACLPLEVVRVVVWPAPPSFFSGVLRAHSTPHSRRRGGAAGMASRAPRQRTRPRTDTHPGDPPPVVHADFAQSSSGALAERGTGTSRTGPGAERKGEATATGATGGNVHTSPRTHLHTPPRPGSGAGAGGRAVLSVNVVTE
ncbi:hypothetical protein THAOC_03648 [Thalassiosira oceanica]|uniref:Uncharacterized protein n=1 Tax=Thalassiosira oceanica TaxID=159749 RepID=K0TPP6_THAOC|nr:hypothetical protein THAOC_03648 [Thalassiosira oceanica]|eukprot:EJK74662.1 hypothetical protein THAOC_03648 [Thalassiosira oceanica]